VLRVVRWPEDVGFSVVEAHVDSADLFEAERSRPYLMHVVDPARGSLSHGFLKRLDKERPNIWPVEHSPIDFGKLLR
jgi:hypothetical protein